MAAASEPQTSTLSVVTGWTAWQAGWGPGQGALLVNVPVHNAWETQRGWTDEVLCHECRSELDETCLCGMVAFERREDIGEVAKDHFVGRVELRGNVRRIAGGWRADQARPIEIHVPEHLADLAPSYARSYACTVRAA